MWEGDEVKDECENKEMNPRSRCNRSFFDLHSAASTTQMGPRALAHPQENTFQTVC